MFFAVFNEIQPKKHYIQFEANCFFGGFNRKAQYTILGKLFFCGSHAGKTAVLCGARADGTKGSPKLLGLFANNPQSVEPRES